MWIIYGLIVFKVRAADKTRGAASSVIRAAQSRLGASQCGAPPQDVPMGWAQLVGFCRYMANDASAQRGQRALRGANDARKSI